MVSASANFSFSSTDTYESLKPKLKAAFFDIEQRAKRLDQDRFCMYRMLYAAVQVLNASNPRSVSAALKQIIQDCNLNCSEATLRCYYTMGKIIIENRLDTAKLRHGTLQEMATSMYKWFSKLDKKILRKACSILEKGCDIADFYLFSHANGFRGYSGRRSRAMFSRFTNLSGCKSVLRGDRSPEGVRAEGRAHRRNGRRVQRAGRRLETMPITAQIIADSVSEIGIRLTTMQLKVPKFILAQFNTHRMFSRNARSSRAVPTKVLLEEIKHDPVLPVRWGKNQPGMQADEELRILVRNEAYAVWCRALMDASKHAEVLADLGAHKEIVNRLIEPFCWAHVVVTATDWKQFFRLRLDKHAQPEMRTLAEAMDKALSESDPVAIPCGSWHLPYVSNAEITRFAPGYLCWDPRKVSAARCARVSYKPFDGENADTQKDIALAESLLNDKHMSPFEHVATPLPVSQYCANFRGWASYRSQIHDETARE